MISLSSFIPILLIMVGSYIVASSCLAVYSVAVDTLFLCFLKVDFVKTTKLPQGQLHHHTYPLLHAEYAKNLVLPQSTLSVYCLSESQCLFITSPFSGCPDKWRRMAEAILYEQKSHEDYEIRKCVVLNTQAQSLSIVLYDVPDKMKIDYLRCWINFIFLKFKPLPTVQCTMYMPPPV